jgi:hypothetical protein
MNKVKASESTTMVAFRVPVSLRDALKAQSLLETIEQGRIVTQNEILVRVLTAALTEPVKSKRKAKASA